MPPRLLDDVVIDRGSFVPPYRQIRDRIVERIQCGQLRGGQKLPISTELRAHLSVSHHTLNRAVQELKREGWVTARAGSGVFVTSAPTAVAASAKPPSLELGVPSLDWMRESKARFINELQRRVPGVRLMEDVPRLDVCNAYGPMLPCLAHELADLTDAFVPDWGRGLDDPRVAPFCHEGRLYIVGAAPIVGVVMVNEAVFSEAGVPLPTAEWTLHDMVAIARRLHAPERGRYGMAMFANYLDFMYFLGHEGGAFFDNTGQACTLDTPEALRAMQLLSDLARCTAEGDMFARMKVFGEGRAGMLLGYPTSCASALRHLSAPLRLLPLPGHRRGIVPLDAGGMAMRAATTWPEGAIQFLKLYLDRKLSGPTPRPVPLCVNRACEDTSPLMQPFREALEHSRDILWNVPPPARTLRHNVALQLFDGRCADIACGDPAEVAPRMRALAADMTVSIRRERLAEHF